MTVPALPDSDDDVPRFLADLGVPGIVDIHAEQVRAVAGWAAADDRLGAPFLCSAPRTAPMRLLGL